jgi:hypothetical protein
VIKQKATETRAKVQGGFKPVTNGHRHAHVDDAVPGQPNGKKQKSINGFGTVHDVVMDEARQQHHQQEATLGPDEGDVHMTG